MSTTLKEHDDKDEELIIVEDESKLQVNQSADNDDDDNDTDDERIANSDDSNESDRESLRERRRLEKLERKERREKAIARDKLEMEFLRKRNEELERRMSAQEIRARQTDLNNYDTQIQAAANDIKLADQIIAKAIEAGNGNDVVEAQRYRDMSIAKVQQLNAAKAQLVYQAPVPQAPVVDDMTLVHAKQFMAENPWYDVNGNDEASAIVMAIDQAIHKEGFRPQTAEYWDELRKRAAARLPDKFGKGSDRQPRGGPAMGSGREHAPASTRKEIYISPERKQALIEAGVWDDPVLRNKYIKRYAEYDRNNKA